MTPARKKRLALVGLMLIGVGAGAGLILTSMSENIMFFKTPTQVAAGDAPSDRLFRMGGMVVQGSVRRPGDGLTVHFDLTDNENQITVKYTGILPDLFREGQGIIANGHMGPDGAFLAEEVLAKHDENYVPRELEGMQEHQAAKMAEETTVGL